MDNLNMISMKVLGHNGNQMAEFMLENGYKVYKVVMESFSGQTERFMLVTGSKICSMDQGI